MLLWGNEGLDGERKAIRHATVGSHPCCLRNARKERRVALDEIEEVLRRESEERCIRFVLCKLDGNNGRAVHPAEGLQIAPVIENRNVYRNFNAVSLGEGRVDHLLGKFGCWSERSCSKNRAASLEQQRQLFVAAR